MQKQGIDISAARQIELGKKLFVEKQTCLASGQTWARYVKENCKISRERADELIRIGVGTLSVAESRSRKTASQQKTRILRDLLINHERRLSLLQEKILRRLEIARPSKAEVAEIEEVLSREMEALKQLMGSVNAWKRSQV